MPVRIGDVFGRLTVVSEAGFDVTSGGYRKRAVDVKCLCGAVKKVRTNDLVSERTVSCGCHLRDVTTDRNITHGKTYTRIFDIWCGMRKRCLNPRAQYYDKYSSFDNSQEWLDSFEKFYEDMSPTYEDGLTLDRIDTFKGYSKENCRWATYEQQARNQKSHSNNTSGVNGVCWATTKKSNGKIHTSAVCCWRENGKQRRKAFSVAKYGLLESFALAVKYRKEQIERLNKLGYGYTDTHGQ